MFLPSRGFFLIPFFLKTFQIHFGISSTRHPIMSSVIFQPLLHDPLGWKASNSTYTDIYTWKMERPNNKEKKISPYGQQYQRQMRKQQKNASLPSVLSAVTSEEQTIQPLVLVKDNRSIMSASHRSSPSKTPPIVHEEPSTIQRPASIIRVRSFSLSYIAFFFLSGRNLRFKNFPTFISCC